MTAQSREGYEIDVGLRRWILSRDVTVKLEWVDEWLGSPLKMSFIQMVAWYASTRAPGTVQTAALAFKALIGFIRQGEATVSEITSVSLTNYRSHLGKSREFELLPLVVLLRHWLRLNNPGLGRNVKETLRQWKIKSAPKGVAVLTRCPRRGALSELEYEGLSSSLIESFGSRKTSLSNYVLTDLMISTGRRPSQLGDLKLVDILDPDVDAHEDCGLVIQFPRRKQRRIWRAAFKPAYLSSEKAAPIRELAALVKARASRIWPTLSSEAASQLPLFPAWSRIRSSRSMPVERVAELAGSEAFHLATREIRDRLIKTVERIGVTSERTLEQLHVFPTRLRRTVATRAAREGYSTLVIAELLDHSDDQNARIYTENVPENAAAINAAIAMQLAPIVQAFCGMLVDREADALRGNDIASRVRTDEGSGVGTCGTFGFCGAIAPIACYTCKAFQPWLDAPHEEVMIALVDERSRIRDLTRDDAIASINDRTILAVAEVIRLCEKRRQEIAQGAQ